MTNVMASKTLHQLGFETIKEIMSLPQEPNNTDLDVKTRERRSSSVFSPFMRARTDSDSKSLNSSNDTIPFPSLIKRTIVKM